MACTTEPDWLVQRSVIRSFNSPVFIEVPDTVSAAEPFAIEITTYHDGCRYAAQILVSSSTEETAVVEPLDSVHVGAELCEANLLQMLRGVTLIFGQAGRSVVRVLGLDEPADTTIVFTRNVTVQ